MTKRLEMAVPVTCHSHRLTPMAFDSLITRATYVWVSDITEFGLFLHVDNRFCLTSREEFIQYGHYSLSMLLIALNVAAMGHFTWTLNSKCPYPQYSLMDPSQANSVVSVSVSHRFSFAEEDIQDITSEDVRRTTLLFFALSKENEPSTVREEYLKGVFHLGYSLFDLDFRRDAFSNFYRSLEFFIARKVLRTDRLSNEVREISDAFQKLGLTSELVDEFKRLYRLRSEQVMHAQRTQLPIEWLDVVKLKIILDCIINLVYRPIWMARLEQSPNDELR